MQSDSLTRTAGLLMAGTMLVACDDSASWETFNDPPDPVFLDTQLSCESGTLSIYALVESDVTVSNLVVERTDIDAAELDPLFPTLDVTANAGGLTRWELELAHDCAASFAATWTAYTVLETSAVTETAWPDVDLDSEALSPPYGSELGGTEVTISGSEMDAVTEVLFGGEPAAISSASDTSLVVVTPPGTPGLVDVQLQAGVTTVELPGSFTYWADQTGLVEGLARTVVQVYDARWFTIGSAYTTLDPYGPFAQHEVVVHEPIDPSQTFSALFPEVGDCSSDASVGWLTLDVGSYIGMDNVELGPLALISTGDANPVYYYVEADTDPSAWDGQLFDLELVSGSDYTPAMVIEEAARVPLMPATTSFDWQSEDTTPWGEELTLSWSSTSAQRVQWTIYPTQGTTVLGSNTCMADASTGELTLPWETMVAGVDETQVNAFYLVMSFIEDAETPLVHDNSTFSALAEFKYWVRLAVSAP